MEPLVSSNIQCTRFSAMFQVSPLDGPFKISYTVMSRCLLGQSESLANTGSVP